MSYDSRIQNKKLKNSIENVQIHNVAFDNGILSVNPLYVDVETALNCEDIDAETALSTEEKSAQSENHLVCLDYPVSIVFITCRWRLYFVLAKLNVCRVTMIAQIF